MSDKTQQVSFTYLPLGHNKDGEPMGYIGASCFANDGMEYSTMYSFDKDLSMEEVGDRLKQIGQRLIDIDNALNKGD